ncbi:MAG: hypothetical protein AB8G99_18915 [Planctomycetaceae bacterium]
MNDARRLGFLAVFFLVALRICIGWQFFYEGLWKYNSLSSTKPWSAEGYLKSAQGPLRQNFHNLAGDGPYDLKWLDYRKMTKRWDDWAGRFLSHYGDLTDQQKGRLNRIINGSKSFSSNLSALPEGVDLEKYKRAISFDADKKKLIVDGKWHLTPVERERLYLMVPDVKEVDGKLEGGTELEREFHAAVSKVYTGQSRLSYKEKLAASLRGDSERVGAILKDISQIAKEEKVNPYKAFGDFKRFGELDKYRAMVKKHEDEVASAKTQFDQDHIAYSWGEIQKEKSKLVGPVKALESEMKLAARDVLTADQLAKGTVPPPMDALTVSNYLTIAGLLILGILLIVGFLSRTAAFFGAVMLFSFYLVHPPWPGVPPVPGPDHSFIVNKNLIEVIALLALACTRSGLWCGLDAVFRKLFGKSERLPAPGKGPIPMATVKS